MDPNETETPEVPEDETPEATPEAEMMRGIEEATETVTEQEEVAPESEEAAPEAGLEAEPTDKPADKPVPDADAEKEIGDLKLKDRAAERFRELSGDVKVAAPVMAAIKDAGIPVEQLPSALKAASDHREWVQQVVDTGASPEQYADSLHLLSLVSKAQQGDHASAEAALQALAPLVADIAKLTGREVPGLHDPLDAHADLQDAMGRGDITREFALETARARQLAANTTQQATQRQQAEQVTQAQQAGLNALVAIDAEFNATDADYARKRPILNGVVQSIRETLPPAQWEAATRRAYASIQVPAAPAANLPAVGHVPLRPTGSRAPNLQPEFTDPHEAMMAGIAAASR